MQLQLEPYQNEYIERETGGRYGPYLRSYRYAGGLVEVHLFGSEDGERTALVSVSPGFPQAVADQVLQAAAAIDHHVHGARRVLSADSLPRTGSY